MTHSLLLVVWSLSGVAMVTLLASFASRRPSEQAAPALVPVATGRTPTATNRRSARKGTMS